MHARRPSYPEHISKRPNKTTGRVEHLISVDLRVVRTVPQSYRGETIRLHQ